MRLLGVTLVSCLLAGCALGAQLAPPLETPQSQAARTGAAPSSRSTVPVFVLGQLVYRKNLLLGYGIPGQSKPTEISKGLDYPSQLGIDSHGTLYVANRGFRGQGTNVVEYASAKSAPIRTVKAGVAHPIAMTVTASGNLYVLNAFGLSSGTLSAYKPGSVAPSLTISSGITTPSDVAAGNSGTVYVANRGSTSPGGNVEVYAPSATTPTTTITSGINQPAALALDGSGNLFAANSFDSVVEFAPGTTTPARTLVVGPTWQLVALATDVLGDLYVSALSNGDHRGEIVEYPPTGTTPLQIIKLTRAHYSASLATDRFANLYAEIGYYLGYAPHPFCSKCSLVEYKRGGVRGQTIVDKAFLLGPLLAGF